MSNILQKTNGEDVAIPFIVFNQKTGFSLNPQAETFLNSLNPDKKLGVVSIVGKYRTGKSFFVNRVLLNRNGSKKGFAVGPTINPCTKGLWLWQRSLSVESPENGPLEILFVDTEGFGGMDENVNHDSRIFLFSLLLSSYFIYNSVGSIDENALNNLSLIINLAKDIQIKSNTSDNEKEDPANYFPNFLWVVRDFALQMVDSMGNQMTQKDYLQKALELQKGVSDTIESQNRIRRLFQHFFKDRDCATMVRPVEAESDLQQLNEMSDNQLRPQFVDQVNNLRQQIIQKVQPKTLNGQALNGHMMVEICQAYIDAINKGSLPNIENAWHYVCQSESNQALGECAEEMKIKLEKIFVKGPISSEQLSQMQTDIKDEVHRNFKQKALVTEKELTSYLEQLERILNIELKDFKKKNKQMWKGEYERLCTERVQYLQERLIHEQYTNFYEFQAEFLQFKEEYEKQTPKAPMKDEYFKEVSEKLFRMAAERLTKTIERESEMRNKTIEQRLEFSQAQLKTRKQDWELEQAQLTARLHELERERASRVASESVMADQLERLKTENTQLEKKMDETAKWAREVELTLEQQYSEKFQECEQQYDQVRGERIKEEAHFEKKVALLEQEVSFAQRDNQSLLDQIHSLETENRRLRTELTQSLTTIQNLQQRVSDHEFRQMQEMQTLKGEFEKKVSEIHEDVEKQKDIIKQHSEWLVEKTYLENQVAFLKNQMEENKRLHDALLMALQQNFSANQDESSNELMETNRNLSAAMDKMELRCKIAQEKAQKLKIFKRMVKNSSALQCLHCAKFIANSIFTNHLQGCINQSNSNGSQNNNSSSNHVNLTNTINSSISSSIMNSSSLMHLPGMGSSNQMGGSSSTYHHQNNPSSSSSSSNAHHHEHGVGRGMSSNGSVSVNNSFLNGVPPLFMNLDPNGLQISINQTMVRESPDNQPYTEYLIQLSYQNVKWTVARKYQNFCELHQMLMKNFPNITFPESSLAIINTATDMKGIFYQKRPTVIEERRKSLQQYLRDCARIDVIRNCKHYQNFLEIDKNLEMKSTTSSSSTTGVLVNNNNSNSNSFVNNIENSGPSAPVNRSENSSQIRNMIQNYIHQPMSSARGNTQARDDDYSYSNNHQNDMSSTTSGTNYKIDQQMLPQSPSSFLQAWSEKQNSMDTRQNHGVPMNNIDMR